MCRICYQKPLLHLLAAFVASKVADLDESLVIMQNLWCHNLTFDLMANTYYSAVEVPLTVFVPKAFQKCPLQALFVTCCPPDLPLLVVLCSPWWWLHIHPLLHLLTAESWWVMVALCLSISGSCLWGCGSIWEIAMGLRVKQLPTNILSVCIIRLNILWCRKYNSLLNNLLPNWLFLLIYLL